MMGWLPVVLAGMYFTFDCNYFIRRFILVITSRFRKRQPLLNTSVMGGICTTSDIDMFLTHMNNARFFREVDLAQKDFRLRCGLLCQIAHKGGSFVNAANTIRYRQPIWLFSRYSIFTKVLFWDKRHLYWEHKFTDAKGRRILAIAMIKQAVMGIDDLEEAIKNFSRENIEKPEPVPELQKWIESNELLCAKETKSQ